MSEISSTLNALYESRTAAHLANDPLAFCHRYSSPADQEIAAVIASAFAYGAIAVIRRNLTTLFDEIGASPRMYVERFEPHAGLRTFSRFRHRFNDVRDLCALLWGMRQIVEMHGSIESFFLLGSSSGDSDTASALNRFSSAFLALDYSPVFAADGIPADSYFRFLFPAPASGSACKRLCMMLRWLVRPADGFDLGLWSGVGTSRLVIPVDTHISRISRYLGFTARKSADWRMATEITAALRAIDPEDPVKFDFSLAHLGISDGCDGNDPERCRSCLIAGICTQSAITVGNASM